MRAAEEREAVFLVDNEEQVWRELVWLRAQNGYKPGWEKATYRDLFNAWPQRWLYDLTPTPASDELIKLVKRRNAKWKRDKKRQEGNGNGAANG